MLFDVPTKEEFREIIREEIAAFFSSNSLGATQPQTPDESDDIGGIDLAIELTGKKKSTIYSLCHRRILPHFKQSGQLYFSKRALLDWLQSGKRSTVTEIQNSVNNQLKGNKQTYEKSRI